MGRKFQIAVIPGDGHRAGSGCRRVKGASSPVEQKGEGSFNFIPFDFGGERYMKNGRLLPDSVLDELKKLDAIYLGAIGHPGS